MKTETIIGIIAAAVLLAGCGKKDDTPKSFATPAKARTGAASSPVAQPAMAALKRGDKAAAVDSFVGADWSVRSLFASGSVLNLSEDQFKALSEAERETKGAEMAAEIELIRKLARAVDQAGRDSASKGDSAQAAQYFISLKQCGTALDSPDCLQLVRMVGQSFKKLSDQEMAKIGP